MAITNNADVARRVRGLAAERQVKQTTLADALRVSRMAMYRRMSGETPITAGELITLADVIGVPVGAFYVESSDDVAAVAS